MWDTAVMPTCSFLQSKSYQRDFGHEKSFAGEASGGPRRSIGTRWTKKINTMERRLRERDLEKSLK